MIKLSEKINLENIQHKCTVDLMSVIMTCVENEGFDAIDWEDALMLLRRFSKNCDDKYNIYPESINNKDELLKLNSSICDAVIGKAPMISRICMDCKRRFYIYLSEKEFFESKGFALPKRCKDCRKNKARMKKSEEM